MTNREAAEMVAKFRTPPGMNWKPLADDIETMLDAKDRWPCGSMPAEYTNRKPH